MNVQTSIVCPVKLAREYDALFLDNDGTCGLTEEIHARIGTDILKQSGVPHMTVEERFSFMGFGEAGIWEYLQKQGHALSITIEQFVRLQSQRFTEAISGITDPAVIRRPGIIELAEEFKKHNKPVWVVSNTPREAVMAVQKAAGLLEVVDGYITYTDIHDKGLKKKPAPDAYLLAKDLTVGRGAHCLAIEDSKTGVQAALDADCDVIEIIYHRLNHTPHPYSTYVVSDEEAVLAATRRNHGRRRMDFGESFQPAQMVAGTSHPAGP